MRMKKTLGSAEKRCNMEQEQPLVSVLVRTCNRPQVLRTALESIRRQTYPRIELIIIEDGTNAAEAMLQEAYADLPYTYEATGEKKGRCYAGNRAMQLASGKYLNFLDDDDAFLPHHIETLVRLIEGDAKRAVYAIAEERQILLNREDYAASVVKKRMVRYRQPFNRMLLYTMNYIPIQSILFERSLFEALGGFDERLDTLEDWDLWVRYSTVTDFTFLDQITSYYHTPYERGKKKKRAAGLKDYMLPLHQKFQTYQVSMSVEQVNREMEYVIREYKNKGLMRYIRLFFRVVFLGER